MMQRLAATALLGRTRYRNALNEACLLACAHCLAGVLCFAVLGCAWPDLACSFANIKRQSLARKLKAGSNSNFGLESEGFVLKAQSWFGNVVSASSKTKTKSQ